MTDRSRVHESSRSPVGGQDRKQENWMRIDIVVVTHNSEHVVGDLLDSLPDARAGLEAQTVVVDNASTDDTLAVLAGRTDVRVLAADNGGYAAGINRGVDVLDGTGPILVLNPDVRLDPG